MVLPDGSVAKVKLDFDTLKSLSKLARDEFGMAGAVQHGASTLPTDAFGKFPEVEAAEVQRKTAESLANVEQKTSRKNRDGKVPSICFS